MSDDKNLVDETIETAQDAAIQEVEASIQDELKHEDSVSYDSHKKLLAQRKADQKRLKDLASKLAEMEAAREAAEKSKLEEKQEYKKLYENALGKIKTMETESAEKEKALVDEHKRRALEKELGGVKNGAYFKFADLSNIVIDDDGLVDQNSVKFEANRFRQQYPELLASSPAVKINSQAPSDDGILKEKKSLNEMTKADRAAARLEYLRKKK